VGLCESLETVLPVEITKFTAQEMEQSILLSWTTAVEANNKGYEIERSSDGNNFELISFVKGNNNSDVEQNYSFEDRKIRYNELYYYRLKQLDHNGNYEYSDVISAKVNKQDRTSISGVFPNPIVDGRFNVELNLHESVIIEIEIFDSFGKSVHRTNTAGNLGKNSIELNLVDLKAGVYFTKISAGSEFRYQKIIVQE